MRDRFCGLVVWCSNAAELLETIEHALDPVAVFVAVEVAVDRPPRLVLGGMTDRMLFISRVARTSSLSDPLSPNIACGSPLTWREREGVCGRNPVPGGGLT